MSQDQPPVSSRNRSRHQQEQQIVRLQSRTRELEEENRSLRTTLRLMGGLAEVRARKVDDSDSMFGFSMVEKGELLVPLILPENWESVSAVTETINGVKFLIVPVSRMKKGRTNAEAQDQP